MEAEREFTIDGTRYRVIFYYGYNSIYYATIYNDDTGTYMGQIDHIQSYDSDVEIRLIKFIKNTK